MHICSSMSVCMCSFYVRTFRVGQRQSADAKARGGGVGVPGGGPGHQNVQGTLRRRYGARAAGAVGEMAVILGTLLGLFLGLLFWGTL